MRSPAGAKSAGQAPPAKRVRGLGFRSERPIGFGDGLCSQIRGLESAALTRHVVARALTSLGYGLAGLAGRTAQTHGLAAHGSLGQRRDGCGPQAARQGAAHGGGRGGAGGGGGSARVGAPAASAAPAPLSDAAAPALGQQQQEGGAARLRRRHPQGQGRRRGRGCAVGQASRVAGLGRRSCLPWCEVSIRSGCVHAWPGPPGAANNLETFRGPSCCPAAARASLTPPPSRRRRRRSPRQRPAAPPRDRGTARCSRGAWWSSSEGLSSTWGWW